MTICKKIFIVAILVLSASANATLINRGGGMIYDDVFDITWLANASKARSDIGANLDWWAAVQWANDLTFGGFTEWRLPDMDLNNDGTVVNCMSQSACLDNEYGYLYNYHGISVTTPGDFTGIDGTLHYWSGTENPTFPSLAYLLNFDTGFFGSTSKSTTHRNAWAVHAGDIGAVPIPAAVWLFGSGLLGLIGFAARKKA